MAEPVGMSHSPHRTSSDNTLDGDREHEHEKTEHKSRDASGQEEEGQQGPPKPVGFFDPRLHKTRWNVAKKWFLMSKSLLVENTLAVRLTHGSNTPDDIHLVRSVAILGCSIQSQRQYVRPHSDSG